MGQWVVTVAGIAILSVLCDIILPEGQTRRYVKTVFGVVVTLVIVQPLVGLFNGDISFSVEENTVEIQQSYVNSVNDRHLQSAAESAKKTLAANGIEANITATEKTVTVAVKTSWEQGLEQRIKELVTPFFGNSTLSVVWV